MAAETQQEGAAAAASSLQNTADLSDIEQANSPARPVPLDGWAWTEDKGWFELPEDCVEDRKGSLKHHFLGIRDVFSTFRAAGLNQL